jgi:plastocyanin
MSSRWWVYLHLAGVFAFLSIHGVSMTIGLRLRKERDAARITALLDLSGRTVPAFYISLAFLVVTGVVSALVDDWFGYGWIWGAILTLVVVSVGMFFMARPYYQRVRFISRAIAEGSKAVTPEQFDSVLRSPRPVTITWMGVAGLGFILYLMLFKPTLGLSPSVATPTVAPTGPVVTVVSIQSRFTVTSLTAPAGTAFSLRFDNRDAGVLHNVAVYADASASRSLFVGSRFPGPRIFPYRVPALPAGTYFFRCDLHPTTMTGSLVVG